MNVSSKYSIALILILMVSSCKTTRHRPHLTEPLYFHSSRINIAHPADGGQGIRVLGEQVSYSLPEEEKETAQAQQKAATQKLDTSKVYAIPQVTVISKAKFAPVREGHVNLDFVLRVPQEYLSEEYQLCMSPQLLHNDSLVALEDVVIRGTGFIAMQERNYNDYNKYISSIIDPQGYDTAFINRAAVEKELNKRRKYEIQRYYNRWQTARQYEEWRLEKQQEHDRYNVTTARKRRKKLEKLDTRYKHTLTRMLVTGQDTSLMARKYRKQRAAILEKTKPYRRVTLGTVPTRFKEIYTSGLQAKDIEPLLPGQKDSLQIASEHLMHDEIAFNEIKGSRREETFNRMVPYPYRHDAHYYAQILPDREFVYRYKREYPVTPGLKKLRLTLKGYIAATDGSRYTIRETDTITFIVSTLDELADASLITGKGFTLDQQQEYAQGIIYLQNREYQKAIGIFNSYKDYNTALTLACLGYDSRAYDLLRQLKETSDTHYLSAILTCRLGEENKAISHLKKALKMDTAKQYRMERDPEISRLIRKYGLKRELDKITEEEMVWKE